MTFTVAQRRIGLGCALMIAIVLTVVGDDKSIPVPVETPKPSSAGPSPAGPEKPVPIEVAKLSRVPPSADGIDVFAAKTWNQPTTVRQAVAPPPPQPVAPPMPFLYVGQIAGREGPTILLSRGAESFAVKAGEPIDNDYRLESVAGEELTIVYLPLNERQILVPDLK
jgi:hypothetical protein